MDKQKKYYYLIITLSGSIIWLFFILFHQAYLFKDVIDLNSIGLLDSRIIAQNLYSQDQLEVVVLLKNYGGAQIDDSFIVCDVTTEAGGYLYSISRGSGIIKGMSEKELTIIEEDKYSLYNMTGDFFISCVPEFCVTNEGKQCMTTTQRKIK